MDMGHEFWDTKSSYLKAKATFLDYNISILSVEYHRGLLDYFLMKKGMKTCSSLHFLLLYFNLYSGVMLTDD